jgi:hypothetical protein
MSNNSPKKPPPHILAAGDAILRDLDLSQKALDDLFDKNGALNFDEDVTANILQAMPTPQPASRRRLHFTPPQLGGPHFPDHSQSTNLPKPPAGRSPQPQRKSPPRECKSKYEMLIRQHQAKIQ